MKLSDLKALVDAMRAKAASMGVSDPNVEFFDGDRQAFQDYFSGGHAFMNMEPMPDVTNAIQEHVVTFDGITAKRGDFAIPMRLV